MFAFKIWGNFGAFRDPLTITQNLTLSIPPKTTIGGILAAILGIDYNSYFLEEEYFNFKYSIILINPVRKKSFSQNYVEDYTKKSVLKYNAINQLSSPETDLFNLSKQWDESSITKSKEFKKIDKKLSKFYNDISDKMTKPKPIYREVLIKPEFIVFISNFKYEKEIIKCMKKHHTLFSLYMGNTEFPANYEILEISNANEKLLNNINSFTQNIDKIKFETGKKYTTVYFATSVSGNRQYRDYKKLVICDETISFQNKISGFSITTSLGDFNCEFI